jgi:hypothetical protein
MKRKVMKRKKLLYILGAILSLPGGCLLSGYGLQESETIIAVIGFCVLLFSLFCGYKLDRYNDEIGVL